jgi:hypothetical protein
MTLAQLLSIPLRIFGIYLLYLAFISSIRLFQFLAQTASITDESGYKIQLARVFIEAGFLIISSLALLKLPLTISRLLIPKKHDSEISTSLTTDQMQSVAFCVLGVYIISMAIPDFTNNASWIIYYSFQPPADRNDYEGMFINQIVTVVELFIGVYLCIKSDGVKNLIRRFRTAGTV